MSLITIINQDKNDWQSCFSINFLSSCRRFHNDLLSSLHDYRSSNTSSCHKDTFLAICRQWYMGKIVK
ncbi:MAG: hypothetical protein JW795_01270 [Chitinivibrionales bacterium]|nr:hypothetical protein [Chitinivibrionales bacterium]